MSSVIRHAWHATISLALPLNMLALETLASVVRYCCERIGRASVILMSAFFATAVVMLTAVSVSVHPFVIPAALAFAAIMTVVTSRAAD